MSNRGEVRQGSSPFLSSSPSTLPCELTCSWKKNRFDGEREKAKGKKGLNERKEKHGKVNLITGARYGSNVS